MAENKTKPTKASVAAFINAVADEARRTDARKLVFYALPGSPGAEALLEKLGKFTLSPYKSLAVSCARLAW